MNDADARSAGRVCIPNIGPRERRTRLAFGVVAIAAGLLLSTALIMAGVHPLWRIIVLLPFWAGATGVFEAREKT